MFTLVIGKLVEHEPIGMPRPCSIEKQNGTGPAVRAEDGRRIRKDARPGWQGLVKQLRLVKIYQSESGYQLESCGQSDHVISQNQMTP